MNKNRISFFFFGHWFNFFSSIFFSSFFLFLQLWTGIDRIISFSFALKMVGMQFFGRPHSGADDARNLARLVCKMTRAGIELTINSEIDYFHKKTAEIAS